MPQGTERPEALQRDQRYLRYSELVSPKSLIESKIGILGVGAIGRQVALQLAAMGAMNVSIQDMDKVEHHNMGTQGFRPSQIGQYKVSATRGDMIAISPNMDVQTSTSKHEKNSETVHQYDVVFCCVDSMEARMALLCDDEHFPGVAIDTRMSAMSMQVFYVDLKNRQNYKRTVFPDSEAFQARCTAKSTIFTASTAASLAVAMWTQGLHGQPPLPFAHLSLTDWTLRAFPLPDNEEAAEAQRPDEAVVQSGPQSER